MHHFDGRPLKEILGKESGRYFGSGHRHIRHTVSQVAEHVDGDRIRLSAVKQAIYPPRWSLDAAGDPREVHLSSIDAISLALKTISLCENTNRGAWWEGPFDVTGFSVVAGRVATTDVGSVTIGITTDHGGPLVSTKSLRARIGGLNVDLECAPSRARPGAAEAAPGLTHAAAGDSIQMSSHVDRVDLVDGHLETSHSVTSSQAGYSAAPPRLDAVDELVMFGQLAQVLIYAVNDTSRSAVPNLWLRRASVSRTPAPSGGQARFSARTSVRRNAEVVIGGRTLRDVRLVSTSEHGASASAAFGYSA